MKRCPSTNASAYGTEPRARTGPVEQGLCGVEFPETDPETRAIHTCEEPPQRRTDLVGDLGILVDDTARERELAPNQVDAAHHLERKQARLRVVSARTR